MSNDAHIIHLHPRQIQAFERWARVFALALVLAFALVWGAARTAVSVPLVHAMGRLGSHAACIQQASLSNKAAPGHLISCAAAQ